MKAKEIKDYIKSIMLDNDSILNENKTATITVTKYQTTLKTILNLINNYKKGEN